MTLLDMMVHAHSTDDLVVAHFDHGIRTDSREDAALVERVARSNGLRCEVRREELGSEASEEWARSRRYKFLREMAKQYDAVIATAHHMDDVTESIIINLRRGTGWRGLAVMGAPDIYRPLLGMTKQEIKEYALDHHLEWHEDSTNQSDDYLRNRIRHHAQLTLDTKLQLLALRNRQVQLRDDTEKEIEQWHLEANRALSRYFFINIPDECAMEILRFVVHGGLTRPQLFDLLVRIKTARPGTIFQASRSIEVSFKSRYFIVKLLK